MVLACLALALGCLGCFLGLGLGPVCEVWLVNCRDSQDQEGLSVLFFPVTVWRRFQEGIEGGYDERVKYYAPPGVLTSMAEGCLMFDAVRKGMRLERSNKHTLNGEILKLIVLLQCGGGLLCWLGLLGLLFCACGLGLVGRHLDFRVLLWVVCCFFPLCVCICRECTVWMVIGRKRRLEICN